MKKLLQEITNTFTKNNIDSLKSASDDLKLTYLYAYYHYYFGDDDSLYDIDERCDKEPSNSYFGKGYFDSDVYEGKFLEIIVPYYLGDEEFDLNQMQYRLGQTINTIVQKHVAIHRSAI